MIFFNIQPKGKCEKCGNPCRFNRVKNKYIHDDDNIECIIASTPLVDIIEVVGTQYVIPQPVEITIKQQDGVLLKPSTATSANGDKLGRIKVPFFAPVTNHLYARQNIVSADKNHVSKSVNQK